MCAPSSSAPIAETSTISLVRTISRIAHLGTQGMTAQRKSNRMILGMLCHIKSTTRKASWLEIQACGGLVARARGSYAPRPQSGELLVAVVLPFENPRSASLDRLADLVAADMERVNAAIISRTGSDVTMIPEVAQHLISSGGKRLRPMLTIAMAKLAGYSGDGHIKLAAAVEFMHTATLLHDDVVDESDMRRGKLAARMLWGNEASVLVGDFLLGQ